MWLQHGIGPGMWALFGGSRCCWLTNRRTSGVPLPITHHPPATFPAAAATSPPVIWLTCRRAPAGRPKAGRQLSQATQGARGANKRERQRTGGMRALATSAAALSAPSTSGRHQAAHAALAPCRLRARQQPFLGEASALRQGPSGSGRRQQRAAAVNVAEQQQAPAPPRKQQGGGAKVVKASAAAAACSSCLRAAAAATCTCAHHVAGCTATCYLSSSGSAPAA